MSRLFWLIGAALAVLPASAQAVENKVLSCKTSKARGAGNPGGPALVANVPGSMTPISLDAVQMTDKKLTKKVIVEGLFARRTPTNSIEVMARFVNCTKKPLAIQVRSSFMDDKQFPTEKPSVWKTVFLSPYATSTYQEYSVGRDAVAHYLVELRANQ